MRKECCGSNRLCFKAHQHRGDTLPLINELPSHSFTCRCCCLGKAAYSINDVCFRLLSVCVAYIVAKRCKTGVCYHSRLCIDVDKERGSRFRVVLLWNVADRSEIWQMLESHGWDFDWRSGNTSSNLHPNCQSIWKHRRPLSHTFWGLFLSSTLCSTQILMNVSLEVIMPSFLCPTLICIFLSTADICRVLWKKVKTVP